MRLQDLSIRAKIMVTALGALLILLGIGAVVSFRYWENEQFALTAEHALMAARAIRPAVEGALAHGQAGSARELLDRVIARPPALGYRVVQFDGTVLLSNRSMEEGALRGGLPLPDPWDISSDGEVLRRRGESAASVVVPLSNVGGPGGRALLELVLDVRKIDSAIRRGRSFGLALTAVLGVAYAVVLGLMLEREIVAPLWQLRSGLARAGAGEPGVRVGLERQDELGRIGASVDALLAKEEEAKSLAASRQRALTEQAGFAEVGALAAQVGHEIKRPLAGIQSAIELIAQEYAMSDSQRQLLARVMDQLDQVNQTVRDLLSLARPVGLNAQPVRLAEVVDAALVRLAGMPGTERVTIERQYGEADQVIWADATRLEQAVLNLLINAVEAMPRGGVLAVEIEAAGAEMELRVSDTGIGIPTENLDRILKPFFSTKPHGTGLGLPLVARVVAAHGGRLGVESEPGRTVFRVRLPVKPPQAQVA